MGCRRGPFGREFVRRRADINQHYQSGLVPRDFADSHFGRAQSRRAAPESDASIPARPGQQPGRRLETDRDEKMGQNGVVERGATRFIRFAFCCLYSELWPNFSVP
jgi:hypothetical protein